MELTILRNLLIKYREADQGMEDEGKQLLAGLEYLIERGEQHLLLDVKYHIDGEGEQVLSQEALNGFYWEIHMFYGHHEEDHDHHHDDDDDDDDDHEGPNLIQKRGWLFVLLTGVAAAVIYVLIRKYHL
jgi:ABC-type Zn2+ transport system substrate-binding protein/surface adhesin